MTTLFYTCVAAIVLVLLWCYVCIRRVARGHWVRHPERTLWFPGVFAVTALLAVLSLMQELDEEARLAMERLAMEREVVELNDCPKAAPGLSDTVALLVNAPAGIAPRVQDCFRYRERGDVLRELRQRRKDKIAEVQ